VLRIHNRAIGRLNGGGPSDQIVESLAGYLFRRHPALVALVAARRTSSGSPQEVFDGVGRPLRRWLGIGLVCEVIDYHQAGDLTAQIRDQERIVVAEGHASIGLAVGTEHICVRKDSVATKHLAFIDRVEANGANAMKQLLAQCEVIYDWRRRSPSLGVDVTGVVSLLALHTVPPPNSTAHPIRAQDQLLSLLLPGACAALLHRPVHFQSPQLGVFLIKRRDGATRLRSRIVVRLTTIAASPQDRAWK
jgi:hypothetical protein